MRFWKFGLFLLFCSLFGLQGCTGAEDKPAQKPEQKPDISFTPSEIQKSEISFLHNNYCYGDKILCTMRTIKSRFNPPPPSSGFTGMKPGTEAPKKNERIFPRGCSFTVNEKALADLDQLLQKGGINIAAATTDPAEVKQLRLLYVEYKNGKHITLNRAGKDSPFRKEVPDEKLAAFMEQLAKDNGQKLYDGTVMLGQLLQCHYSSAGSSSGGHHFIDLSRKSKTEALSAQMMDDMEALGREYKIDTWEPFRETDLIALDAASVSISLSYGKPWSWVKWDMRMGPHHEFTRPQSEYYRKIYKQLLDEDKKGIDKYY